ncbi:hypothetical protein HZD82_24455, partial [Pantoea agglomerans]|nr:hypothetical protein [Pantoea agglomerans]
LRYLRSAQQLSQRMVTGNDFMLGIDEAECEFLHGNLTTAQISMALVRALMVTSSPSPLVT